MSTATRVARRPLLDGQGCLLELGPPPANILDQESMAGLSEELRAAAAEPGLKLLVLAGAGDHFSYGASVPEHRPGKVERMLPAFHQLLRDLNQLPLPPVVAAVRGRCLGGGLELALACDLLVVEPDAQLGCPEIKLAVFPPAACALLPLRVGSGRAAELVLSGRLLGGSEAVACRLAEVEAPSGQLLETVEQWAREALLPLSAEALRHGRRAARWPWRDACERVLPDLEARYLKELMKTHDAVEGLEAFLAKRKPVWEDR